MSNKNTLFEELVKFKHKGEETVILEKKTNNKLQHFSSTFIMCLAKM